MLRAQIAPIPPLSALIFVLLWGNAPELVVLGT